MMKLSINIKFNQMEKKNKRITATVIVVAVTTFLAFVVLKLFGIIAWSWWWITAPLWGPLGLFWLAAGFLAMCLLILSAAAKNRK